MDTVMSSMLARLQQTSWLPGPAESYLANPEGRVGRLNVAWVLMGRPDTIQGFFSKPQSLAVWYMVTALSKEKVSQGTVDDYATLLTQEQFIHLVQSNPAVFEKFMPMHAWVNAFKIRTSS